MWGRLVTCGGLVIRLRLIPELLTGRLTIGRRLTNLPHMKNSQTLAYWIGIDVPCAVYCLPVESETINPKGRAGPVGASAATCTVRT
jgi:hypothetical protein